jgi:hypothetical protein
MKTRSFDTLSILGSLVILVAALTVGVQPATYADASKSPASSESCRAFVQQFYNWYVKDEKMKGGLTKYDYTLKYKTAMFAPILIQKLKEDAQAAAKTPSELVGLDFDPFINSQENPGRMVAQHATMKGDHCFVDVFDTPHDPVRKNEPDVIPELTLKNGQWIFVNFHYPTIKPPEKDDLLTVLKSLAADRIKYPVSKSNNSR